MKFKVSCTEFYHTWYDREYEVEVPGENLEGLTKEEIEEVMEASEWNQTISVVIDESFEDRHDTEITRIK